MCKNPKYFNDPDIFDPSRFDESKERYIIIKSTNNSSSVTFELFPPIDRVHMSTSHLVWVIAPVLGVTLQW